MTLQKYRGRPHWSYSAINQFMNICSLQFAFDRIYKLPKAFTPMSLSFGSTFHRVMEFISLVRKEGRVPAKKDAGDLFGDLFERQLHEDDNVRFDEDTDKDTCIEQGRNMIACFVENIDPEERVLNVNEAFAVPLIDQYGEMLERPLIGEIDCVTGKAGQTVIVDWKTSGRRWPKSKALSDLQPTAFLYAYKQLHGTLPEFRFDVVVKTKVPTFEQHVTQRDADHFHRLVALTQRVESMVAAEHFLPNEQSFYCAGCPHGGACKSWHRQQAKVISVAA